MKNKNYNGWTNYATWKTNMEIVSDLIYNRDDDFENIENEDELINLLKEEIENYRDAMQDISEDIEEDDYFDDDFVNSIDWRQIAKSYMQEYTMFIEDENGDEWDAGIIYTYTEEYKRKDSEKLKNFFTENLEQLVNDDFIDEAGASYASYKLLEN